MILLGARAEPAGNPRFSATDKEVGHGDFALKQLDKIKAPEEKKARSSQEWIAPESKELASATNPPW